MSLRIGERPRPADRVHKESRALSGRLRTKDGLATAPSSGRREQYERDPLPYRTAVANPLADVAELLGDSKRVASDHYVYALTGPFGPSRPRRREAVWEATIRRGS